MVFPFQNTFARLPEPFYEKVEPTPVLQPSLIRVNDTLASDLGIPPEFLHSEEGLAVCAGNLIPEGAQPLAMAYAGHQFAHFVPLLGDGRAILVGEISGRDIQLKGSGPTPFSRRGDGRSALGPVLREYLVSEAMHALGVPTTRALAAVASGEMVLRETPEKGGILTRVATSHLRVGTVQYFAGRRDRESLETLLSYAIQRLDPNASTALEFLRGVIERQAALIAKWMGLGFIHGVMNTDNMSLSGETIDYGPCAFMDHFNPAQKFSFIDRGGRYAYQNQPGIAQWNLARLAEALLPLLHDNEEKALELAKRELQRFPDLYEQERLSVFSKKLGHSKPVKPEVIDALLDLMAGQRADFTMTFRSLGKGNEEFLANFTESAGAEKWLEYWRGIGPADPALMASTNPVFIPRNHQIEKVIEAANRDDFSPFHKLCEILVGPFDEQPEHETFALPPAPDEVVCATFCGT